MDITNDKVRKNAGTVLLFIFLTLPFYQIDYFVDNIGWAGRIYTAMQLMSGLVILFIYYKERLFKKISPVFILIAGILCCMCLGSLINGEFGVKRALQYSFATIIISLVIEYGILKDLKHFLMAQIIFFGLLTLINLITVFCYKDGMYILMDHYKETWFLGFESGHIPYQLALLFSVIMYIVLFEKKMYAAYVCAAGILLSNYKVTNSTAVAVVAAITVVILIPKLLKFTKIFNIITYFSIAAAVDLIFVVFRKQEIFKWLIVDIFHKRLDLTHRADVWVKAMKEIGDHPVIGHGYQNFVFSKIIITTHNEYLEVLYKCGIIGLMFFMAFLFYSMFKLIKNRKERAAQWISVFLGAYFMMFIMEQYAFANFFLILLFAVHVGDLKRLRDEQKEKEDSFVAGEAGRVERSAKNFVFTMAANCIAILIGLLAQKLFISILGLEYAGLNGLFSNVITMLALADLGIGEAVVFHLYKPLKDKDEDMVRSLMNFYRKAFRIVAGIIAVIGVCLIPVLPYITGKSEVDMNLTLIFLIFLADTVFSYFLSYKRAILYADQKNFFISMIHMIYLISVNTAQLLMLYFTRDYYAYLLVKLAFRVFENVAIAAIANKLYPYLKEKSVKPLEKNILADIKKKVGALFFHKIGSFVVNGTDNILISVFLGLSKAGLYNNYFIVIDAATKLINPAIGALTPSVGNMLVSEDREHSFKIFRRMRFMNFWIAAVAATTMFVMIQPFVGFWFGAKYLLSVYVAMILSLQFYQLLMRGTFSAFQDAAGIFYENRFVPLIESLLNLVSSIILLKMFGLAGVFMGTIVSSLALWCFSYPKFVYTKLFGRKWSDYILEMAGYLAVFIIVFGATYIASYGVDLLIPYGGIKLMAADLLLCMILPNIMLWIIFRKSELYKYFRSIVKEKLHI